MSLNDLFEFFIENTLYLSISLIGFLIIYRCYKKIKSGNNTPLVIYSLLVSLLYFCPTFLVRGYFDLMVFLEKFYQNKNILYYTSLKNISSQTFIYYGIANLIFVILIYIINCLPVFSLNYKKNDQLLEKKAIAKFGVANHKNKRKILEASSNLFILIFLIGVSASLFILPLIFKLDFTFIFEIRHRISEVLFEEINEELSYVLLIIRFIGSVMPIIICSAFWNGNKKQKIIITILSPFLILGLTKLPFFLYFSVVSFLFIQRLFVVKKRFKNFMLYINLKILSLISIVLGALISIYQIFIPNKIEFVDLLDIITRFTLAPHGSNLTTLYFWQLSGYQSSDLGGSRLAALFNGVDYIPSNYMLEISNYIFGFKFGNTSSFVSLSLFRGGFLLLIIELSIILFVPIVFDFIFRKTNSIALREYLRFASVYYVFLSISVDTQTLLTYHLFGYSIFVFLLIILINKFSFKENRRRYKLSKY